MGAVGLVGTAWLQTEFGRALEWWGTHFEGPFVEVYLSDSITDDAALILCDQLETDDRIQRAAYISSAMAQAEAEIYLGAIAFTVLPDNPLPASIRLEVTPEHKSGGAVRQLTDSLAAISGVTEIVSAEQQLALYDQGKESITNYQRLLTFIALAWTGFWLFCGVYLIGRVRTPQWQIWRYLGARPGWFRWPLVFEGAILGLGCSIIAGGFLYLAHSTEQLVFVFPIGADTATLLFITAPALIGALGGWLAYRIHRHHGVSF